jgi:hypothetical protein
MPVLPMYELVRRLTLKQLAQEQMPLLIGSLAIAEYFYKFHSFLLESLAFLVTWFALGGLHAALKQMFVNLRGEDHGN